MTLDLAAGGPDLDRWVVEPMESWNDNRIVGIQACLGEPAYFNCIRIGGAEYISEAGIEGFAAFDLSLIHI